MRGRKDPESDKTAVDVPAIRVSVRRFLGGVVRCIEADRDRALRRP
jgi:hypothetical protein